MKLKTFLLFIAALLLFWEVDTYDQTCRNTRPCGSRGNCYRRNYWPYYYCSCYSGYSGSRCLTDTVCGRNPCGNGGSCTRRGSGYRCTCRSGFSGSTCRTHVCQSVNCRNGGTCVRTNTSPFYRCSCRGGFSGGTCQTHICSAGYCQNNSTCQRTTTSPFYSCNCSSWDSGYNCTTDICDLGYCENNSTCSRASSEPFYSCNCSAGHVDYNCTTDLCDPNPCLNGGRCERTPGAFSCICGGSYYGRTCETDAVAIGVGVATPVFLLLLLLILLCLKKSSDNKHKVLQRALGKTTRRVKSRSVKPMRDAGNRMAPMPACTGAIVAVTEPTTAATEPPVGEEVTTLDLNDTASAQAEERRVETGGPVADVKGEDPKQTNSVNISFTATINTGSDIFKSD